jgi:16S rRNA (guanine527-N7)-methyltransferase
MKHAAAVSHPWNDLGELLGAGAARVGIALNEAQVRLLLEYLRLIEKWNRTHNLTAIRDVGKMVTHHLLDSLAIVPFIHGANVLDVGSGAGLPGIPIAIARQEFSLTLMDSNGKKAAFLEQARLELGLANIRIVCSRVEAWSGDTFNTIVSRAYSELGQFVRSSRHLLCTGGVLTAMKGTMPHEELSALPAGFRVRDKLELKVPGLNAARHLIVIERT